MSESTSYGYMGIQALPPRRNGRDRRRMNKALGITDSEESAMNNTAMNEEMVIDDPFSPHVEEYNFSTHFILDLPTYVFPTVWSILPSVLCNTSSWTTQPIFKSMLVAISPLLSRSRGIDLN